jgi:hypothetical protein
MSLLCDRKLLDQDKSLKKIKKSFELTGEVVYLHTETAG